MNLAPIGLWTPTLDQLPKAEHDELLRELEELGYGAIWFPDAVGRDPLVAATLVLNATKHMIAGTSVVSLYARGAVALNAAWRTIEAAFPGRFMLGIGVSHAPAVEGFQQQTYGPPLTTMRAYLDRMDAAPFYAYGGDTQPRRVLAALGPKMLALAAERTDGANPYNVTPEHTQQARAILGPDKLLIVEQKAALTTDLDVARAAARETLAIYLSLPNYVNNWRRLGFTDDDFADGGSNRLLDAMVVSGNEAAIAARVQDHREAGADHVALHVVGTDGYRSVPADDWRRLARAVTA